MEMVERPTERNDGVQLWFVVARLGIFRNVVIFCNVALPNCGQRHGEPSSKRVWLRYLDDDKKATGLLTSLYPEDHLDAVSNMGQVLAHTAQQDVDVEQNLVHILRNLRCMAVDKC